MCLFVRFVHFFLHLKKNVCCKVDSEKKTKSIHYQRSFLFPSVVCSSFLFFLKRETHLYLSVCPFCQFFPLCHHITHPPSRIFSGFIGDSMPAETEDHNLFCWRLFYLKIRVIFWKFVLQISGLPHVKIDFVIHDNLPQITLLMNSIALNFLHILKENLRFLQLS